MILIGMTGPIGHGKSTLATALTKLDPTTVRIETSMIIAEIVNELHASTKILPKRDDIESINTWLRPLPAILLGIVNVRCSFDDIKVDKRAVENHPGNYEKLFLHIDNLTHDPLMLKNAVNKENKEAYRSILQWLGGYLVGKLGAGIWYDEIVRRIHTAAGKGCRLCIVGGLRFPSDANYIRENGGSIIKVYRPGHLQYDMLDPTERERENIKADSVVASTGGIEDVERCAHVILQDLTEGKLKKSYNTIQL